MICDCQKSPQEGKTLIIPAYKAHAAAIWERAPLLKPNASEFSERYDAEIWRRIRHVFRHLQPKSILKAGLEMSRLSLCRVTPISPMVDLRFQQRLKSEKNEPDPSIDFMTTDLDALLIDIWIRLHKKSCCKDDTTEAAHRRAFGPDHVLMTSAFKVEKQSILKLTR